MESQRKFARTWPKNLYVPKKTTTPWRRQTTKIGYNNCLIDRENLLPLTAYDSKTEVFQMVQASLIKFLRNPPADDIIFPNLVSDFFKKIPAFKASQELEWATDMLNTYSCGILNKFITWKKEFTNEVKFFKMTLGTKQQGVCKALKFQRSIKDSWRITPIVTVDFFPEGAQNFEEVGQLFSNPENFSSKAAFENGNGILFYLRFVVKYVFAPEVVFQKSSDVVLKYIRGDYRDYGVLRKLYGVVPVFDISKAKKGTKLHFIGDEKPAFGCTEFDDDVKKDLNDFWELYINDMKEFSAGTCNYVAKTSNIMDFLWADFDAIDIGEGEDDQDVELHPVSNYKHSVEDLTESLTSAEKKILEKDQEIVEYKSALQRERNLVEVYEKLLKRRKAENQGTDDVKMEDDISVNPPQLPSLSKEESSNKNKFTRIDVTEDRLKILRSGPEESKDDKSDDEGTDGGDSDFGTTGKIIDKGITEPLEMEGGEVLFVTSLDDPWKFLLGEVLGFVKSSQNGAVIKKESLGLTREAILEGLLLRFCLHFRIKSSVCHLLNAYLSEIFETVDPDDFLEISQHHCNYVEEFFVDHIIQKEDEDLMRLRVDTYPKKPYVWNFEEE